MLVKEREAVQTIMENKIKVLVQSVAQAANAVVASSPASMSQQGSSAAQALTKDVAALQRLVNASIAALRNAAATNGSNGSGSSMTNSSVGMTSSASSISSSSPSISGKSLSGSSNLSGYRDNSSTLSSNTGGSGSGYGGYGVPPPARERSISNPVPPMASTGNSSRYGYPIDNNASNEFASSSRGISYNNITMNSSGNLRNNGISGKMSADAFLNRTSS